MIKTLLGEPGEWFEEPSFYLWSRDRSDFFPLAAAVRALSVGSVAEVDLRSLPTWCPDNQHVVIFALLRKDLGAWIDRQRREVRVMLSSAGWAHILPSVELFAEEYSSPDAEKPVHALLDMPGYASIDVDSGVDVDFMLSNDGEVW